MKEKKSIVFYHEDWEYFKLLTNEELGKLMRCVFFYETEGIAPGGLDDKEELIFTVLKQHLDRDRERYNKICQRNKNIALNRWKNVKEKADKQ